MDNDIELFLRGVVEVTLWSLWLAIVGLAIYLIVLWLSMFSEVKGKRRRFIVSLFPVHMFDATLLSSKGQQMRKRFVKASFLFLLIIVIYCAVLISGVEGLNSSMF